MRLPTIRVLSLCILSGWLAGSPVAQASQAVPTAPTAPADGAVAVESLASSASTVTVTGTSSLHDWTVVAAKSLRGSLLLPAGFLDGDTTVPVTGRFAVPALALHSEHDKMNKLMWGALLAQQHPDLTFELKTARLLPGATGTDAKVDVAGVLTVAGVAKPVTLVLAVRRTGGQVTAKGDLPLKMSDFGIKPPTAMLGTIRTGDVVVVTIETALAPVR